MSDRYVYRCNAHGIVRPTWSEVADNDQSETNRIPLCPEPGCRRVMFSERIDDEEHNH